MSLYLMICAMKWSQNNTNDGMVIRVGRKTPFFSDRLGTLREFSLGIDNYYTKVSVRSDDVSPGQ